MAKKNGLEQKIDALTSIVEKGFAAVAEDISKLAPKASSSRSRRK